MKLCSISSETENDDVSSGIKGATTDAFLLLFVLLSIQNTDCICRHVRCVHGEGREDGKSFFAKMRDASIVFGNWDKIYGCRPIPSRDLTEEISIPSVSITEQHSV